MTILRSIGRDKAREAGDDRKRTKETEEAMEVAQSDTLVRVSGSHPIVKKKKKKRKAKR